MISIPRFPDLLVGLAPVILGPREVEPVRFGAFTFRQYVDRDYRRTPTRLYWPDADARVIVEPEIQDMPFNPVRPTWRRFPGPAEVPFPAPPPTQTYAWHDGGNGMFYYMGARYFERWGTIANGEFSPDVEPLVATRGDTQSTVPADTIETLVDLARAGNREDFLFLAGASGVRPEQHEELWAGTRKRLGLP